ncbi:hypothetical protein BTURTLESOX_1306 [bacterium endosymbiont of Bathymodiolus sp. 5 South]|nr:hypothetical protein BCLUESOX_1768 [bacterium endosymbiont of Bathymodiolus sp. 5 South]SSC08118.1 hypothetical protein BTURTLESOX_1306 [bacterium endosymbiont of Bathymodiolus sp. 5 South]VVH56845.1 hypothetical protein BSPCLSOX_243 [uncultured Gammaproteobacteria bacterium]VVH62435.1 hypothetical protein BSPWISOX_696 [uncultured Gammaproteobacteria bacterium]
MRAHLSEHDNLDIVKVNSRPLKTISKQTKKHPSTHNQNQQNCFICLTTKKPRVFYKK